jgi:hypothetical protein
MRASRFLIAALAGLWLAACGQAAGAAAFSDWSAVVIAGDWRGSGGGPTEAFDNARRDVAAALTRAGFQPQNLRQFSTRPDRYADTRPAKSSLDGIYGAMTELAAKAPGGCLFYVTTHGTPRGAVVDDKILAPGVLAGMLDRACGQRPTVVVVSACFSGVFVPQLAKPNRMVLTAARPDRTSFGCGETNKYPYFDDCFLSSMPAAHDFGRLATAVRECVRVREIAEKMSPPSEPQIWVGGELRPVLPLLAFDS